MGAEAASVDMEYMREIRENTREIKELLKSILATLEVLEDKYLVEQIRESDEQIRKGEYERFI